MLVSISGLHILVVALHVRGRHEDMLVVLSRVKELMVPLGIFKYLYSTRMPSEVLISQLISAGSILCTSFL